MAPRPVAELGTAFLERLASHMPEDQREQFRSMALGVPAVVEEAGNGALRQEDFSATRDRQATWYGQTKAKLDDYDRLKAAADDQARLADPNGNRQQEQQQQRQDPNAAPITLGQALALEQQSVGLTATLATLTGRHAHEFHEPLDCETLVSSAIKAGMNVKEFYAQSVQERRDTIAKTANEAALAAAREEGRLAGRTEVMTQRSDIPYPVGSSAPSTLSGLRKDANAPAEFSLDAAIHTLVEETNRQTARS